MSNKKKQKKQRMRARQCTAPACERITLRTLCDKCRRASPA
jgi:hypothetical protein